MGKAALKQYRARKTATFLRQRGRPKGFYPGQPAAIEAVILDERIVTRVVAALIHNVPISVIAKDLHVPRRAVAIIAMRERSL